MGEQDNASKPPKRIRMGDLPYSIGIGGKKESNDMKLMFIEKGNDKHYTISIIRDPKDEKLVFDIHTTNQVKKAKALELGISPRDAYESLIRMSFDIKQLTRDGAKIEKEFGELAVRCNRELENTDLPRDCTIIPLPQSNLIEEHKDGKEINIDNKKLLNFIGSIHSIEDLERAGCDKAIIRDEKGVREVIFKKNGKWHYFDFNVFMKEILSLLEPYINIDGRGTKEEFFEKIRKEI